MNGLSCDEYHPHRSHIQRPSYHVGRIEEPSMMGKKCLVYVSDEWRRKSFEHGNFEIMITASQKMSRSKIFCAIPKMNADADGDIGHDGDRSISQSYL